MRNLLRRLALGLLAASLGAAASAQPGGPRAAPNMDVLSQAEWRRVDAAIERGLAFLTTQQADDGAFASAEHGQPGVTSLCLLAMLSRGHQPGAGPYGDSLQRGLSYVLGVQRRNGLLAAVAFDGPIVQTPLPHEVGVAGAYNHAIAGLMLSEAYAMAGPGLDEPRVRDGVARAVRVSLQTQRWPKPHAADQGGWRYLHHFDETESDLSIAGWNVKFLRSAKNAGFDVPASAINDAVDYVLRCHDPRQGTFAYAAGGRGEVTRGMAGAGILALAHSGRHDRPEALSAADWLLTQTFTQYNDTYEYGNRGHRHDRYHYGVYLCCQAMHQIGGRHWAEFYPPTARTLLENQGRDGAWAAESNQDAHYGRAYTTALAVLALGAPNQLLPVFQR